MTEVADKYMEELTDIIPSELLVSYDNRKYALYLFAMATIPPIVLVALYSLPISQVSYLFIFSALTGIWSTYWGYIGHDFAHKTGFSSQTLNKVLSHICWALAGYGHSAWNYNHNTRHHPNREEIDEIEYCEISASRYPNILVPLRTFLKNCAQVIPAPLYLAVTTRTVDSYVSMVLAYIVHAIRYKLIYTLSNENLALVLLAFVIHVVAAMAMFTLTFAVGHANSELIFYDNTPVPWSKYQYNGTQSIKGGIMTSLIMGLCLKYQIEHHLFPGVTPFSYPKMKPYIKAFAEEKDDLMYTENSLFDAVIDMCFHKRKNQSP